jgi:hypothetical protein
MLVYRRVSNILVEAQIQYNSPQGIQMDSFSREMVFYCSLYFVQCASAFLFTYIAVSGNSFC